MTANLQAEMAALLYREARLLDEARYEEWLEWLSPEILYRMPTRFVRKATERAQEFSSMQEGVDLLHEDFEALQLRVKKTRHRMSWTDNPAPRTVHVISNVEAFEVDDTHCQVLSVCDVTRSRFANTEDRWALRRDDLLERAGDGWLLRERTIYSPAPVLASGNLAIFF